MNRRYGLISLNSLGQLNAVEFVRLWHQDAYTAREGRRQADLKGVRNSADDDDKEEKDNSDDTGSATNMRRVG